MDVENKLMVPGVGRGWGVVRRTSEKVEGDKGTSFR